jgi:hypothetical protein
VRTAYPVGDMLTPANMTALRELNRIGRYRAIYEEELTAARRTGKMSERGIEALWEFEPAAARQLVGRSGLGRAEQARVLAQTPGQPMPAGTRVMGGVLLAVAIFQEIAPIIQAEQARSFDENVSATLRDIMWWQSKGVFPRIQALNASVLPDRDEWTQDPKRVQELIDAKNIDFLVVLGIEDPGWDAFTIWASTHLNNLIDWDSFILNSHAIRSQGQYIDDRTWEYRKGTIAPGKLYGHNLVEQWERNDRLTRILQTAARRVLDVSKQQIAAVATGPGPYGGPAYTSADKYSSREIYTGKPKAIGQKTFKPGIASPSLYTIASQHRIRDFDADARFFVFPKAASPDPIPSGYVLVGGADYNTYVAIYETRNFVRGSAAYDQLIEPNRLELLLAEADDLRDLP